MQTRDRNINITDRDELAKLRDQQAQRLTRPFLDGWNSEEMIDALSRASIVIGASITLFAAWQMSGWSSFVGSLIVMLLISTIGYRFFRDGDKAIQSLKYFAYFAWLGVVLGVTWHLAVVDIQTFVGGLF